MSVGCVTPGKRHHFSEPRFHRQRSRGKYPTGPRWLTPVTASAQWVLTTGLGRRASGVAGLAQLMAPRGTGRGAASAPGLLAPPPRGAETCISAPPDETLENNMSFPPPPRWARAVFTVGRRSLCYFHSLSAPSGGRADGKQAGP